jgi:RNA polymerase-binding transcription factor DksA
MGLQRFRRNLLALEASLSQRSRKPRQDAMSSGPEGPANAADASVGDFGAGEAPAERELDATVLQQVRDALLRIDAGTFGSCGVDGGAIEKRRLEVMLWTPYCLRHAQALDGNAHRLMPRL